MAVTEEKGQHGLDVYARPFVPQIFNAINEAVANVVPSLPAKHIDFDKYAQSFAGFIFLNSEKAEHGKGTEQEYVNHTPTATPGVHDTPELVPETYYSYFLPALDKETTALQQECDNHALYRVPIFWNGARDPRPNMYTLQVPGLSESSLRIEVGDIVQLRQLRFSPRGEVLPPTPTYLEFQYDSVVWGIDRQSETLSLRVDNLMPLSMLFNACFTVQAGRVKAMRRAVGLVAYSLTIQSDEKWMRSMLFPSSADGYYQKTLNKAIVNFDLYDELLNYEQRKAVNAALNETYGPVPFIISGPPGTGKTKTIVELALQQIKENSSAHLLVCAPSDPAADTLVQRLGRHLKPAEMLRLNSPSRSFPEVHSTILPYCCVDDGMFSLPLFDQIMARRIIVTTCRDAVLLVEARLTNCNLFDLEKGICNAIHPSRKMDGLDLHFTSLLIDEAAQATEPEALIPLTVVAPPPSHTNEKQWPVFVMAGDQHQLGPRTASNTGVIQTSLFERLLNRSFYRDHPLARSRTKGGVIRPLTQDMLPIIRPAFANLIRNYRSHPTILAMPSSLFYNDTLEPEAADTEGLIEWSRWARAGYPVLFARNTSSDEIEQDSGGWYNIDEARMACQYAKSFLESSLIEPSDICIMSPFQAQVKVIRKFARTRGMHSVNIGPLEAFQGLESRLVILCTTRTRDRFLDQDLARGLGVIHEAKRFNVALTRAKEGLIVIGNPDVLKQDQNWDAFLAFCARNKLTDRGELDIDTLDQEIGSISRLERQHNRRMEGEHDSEGSNGIANGFRKLRFMEDPDHALWKSGVEIEASLNRSRLVAVPLLPENKPHSPYGER